MGWSIALFVYKRKRKCIKTLNKIQNICNHLCNTPMSLHSCISQWIYHILSISFHNNFRKSFINSFPNGTKCCLCFTHLGPTCPASTKIKSPLSSMPTIVKEVFSCLASKFNLIHPFGGGFHITFLIGLCSLSSQKKKKKKRNQNNPPKNHNTK